MLLAEKKRLVMVLLGATFAVQAIPAQAQPDTTRPQLLSLSFSPTAIDVGAGPQSVTVRARIVDEGLGVRAMGFVQVGFRSPSDLQGQGGFLTRVSGTAFDGIYEGALTFPQNAENGIWRIRYFIALDAAFNGLSLLSAQEIQARGFPTELSVISPAPAATPPRQLAATVSSNSVTLTWLPPVSGPTVIGYLVEVTLTPGDGAVVARLNVGPTTPFVTATAPNGLYYVRVRAVDSGGVSPTSNEVTVSVGAGGSCVSSPAPPTGLTATVAGNIVSLAWGASAGGQVDRYDIRVRSTPSSAPYLTVSAGASTNLTATAPAGTYYVAIVANNACGASAESNVVAVLVPAGSP